MNRRDEILNYFENIIPDYYKSNSIRQYQVQMALDVMNFFMPDNHKRLMFIEAPVGTGKTLGALIPALLERQRQNKQVLYATSTINLQGQIWSEEIPIAKNYVWSLSRY